MCAECFSSLISTEVARGLGCALIAVPTLWLPAASPITLGLTVKRSPGTRSRLISTTTENDFAPASAAVTVTDETEPSAEPDAFVNAKSPAAKLDVVIAGKPPASENVTANPLAS